MSREERDCVCRRQGDGGSGQPFALPGAEAVYAPDRVCDASHIRLELTLDFATASVSGCCTTTLSPLNDGPARPVLDAVEMTIESVQAAGAGVPYSYDGKQLTLELGERRAGETIEVAIRYRATPRRGLYFLAPDAFNPERPVQAWTQGQDEDNRCWFPCFDHPHERATSEVIATVPAPMMVLSNGRLVASRDGDGTRTFHYRHDVPHSSYLITLVAGVYVEIAEREGEVGLSCFVPAGREEDARRSFARTGEMLRLFGERIGHPYPYERYAQIVVADFIFGGMENTSATTLTDQTLHDARAHLDYSSEPLVAHELAHQWFGDLLTCRDWSHGWLNEGFATYFEILWQEHAEGRDEADVARDGDLAAYFEEDAGRYRRPIVTRVFHAPIDVFDRHLYEKGGAVLHMLRHQLGDARFWRAIHHYVARHRGASVETRDLARAVDDATGVNVDRFFDQWLWKAGHPELKVEVAWDGEHKLVRVAVKQAQAVTAETPLFVLPLTVRFVLAGVEQDVRLEVSRAEETCLLPLAAKPDQVVIDPGANLLARIEVKKADELWRTELRSARHAIDRRRAARAMAESADPGFVAVLATAALEDPFWAVRGEAAVALAAIRTIAARDAVIAALQREPHPRARRMMVRALAAFRRDGEVAAVVAGLLERGDPSYFVEAEAVMTLGRLRAEGAFEAVLSARDRPSFLDVIGANVLGALAELRDERGVEVALAETARGRPAAVRRAAIGTLAVLGDLHSAHRLRALDTLGELLEDPDVRVRVAAVDALGTLGDARAVGPLLRAGHADLDARVRRRVREVVRRLESGRREPEKLGALREELEQVRRESDRLRERVLKLESIDQGGGGRAT